MRSLREQAEHASHGVGLDGKVLQGHHYTAAEVTQRSAQLNSEEGAVATRLGVLPASSNGVGCVQVAAGVEMRL